MIYSLQSISVLSFYIDVALTISISKVTMEDTGKIDHYLTAIKQKNSNVWRKS